MTKTTEQCISCGLPFKYLYRKDLCKLTPKVCSRACFIDVIKNVEKIKRKRGKFTLDNIEYRNPADGVVFRSNYEYRLANMLRENKIKYEFEPYMFKLNDKCFYVPDFWLPKQNIFIETKGRWFGKAKTKVREFSSKINSTFIVVDSEMLRILTSTRVNK